MSDQDASKPLTGRALEHLRKLAAGNGLEPAAIETVEAQEDIFTIKGRMSFSPLFETENATYAGGPRHKESKKVLNFAAIQGAVAEHQKEFREHPDWVEAAIQEIKTHDQQGWGLDGAKVTLADMSSIYVATETCPSCSGRKTLTCTHCQGRGEVICNQCQGQGREQCTYCMGHGRDPQQPDRMCPTCNGTRYATCRFCQMRGYLPCPTCNGKRGTPCPTCQAAGMITQEVTVTCGAQAHFKLETTDLPSGLRRGFERVGIANLGKGHADISSSAISKSDAEEKTAGNLIPVLDYEAKLPYAEMRMRFGAKKAIISIFGKRCIMMGVPYFLDGSLQIWRERLRAAAAGQATLESACEARAIGDALTLCVAGKDRVQDLHKLYPFGLSPDAMTGILIEMRQALKKTTLNTRVLIAACCALFSAVFFYEFFRGGLEISLVAGKSFVYALGCELGALAAVLIASWAFLNFSARFVLQRRFPQLKLAMHQKIGKIGLTMLGAIALAFIAMLISAPYQAALRMLLRH